MNIRHDRRRFEHDNCSIGTGGQLTSVQTSASAMVVSSLVRGPIDYWSAFVVEPVTYRSSSASLVIRLCSVIRPVPIRSRYTARLLSQRVRVPLLGTFSSRRPASGCADQRTCTRHRALWGTRGTSDAEAVERRRLVVSVTSTEQRPRPHEQRRLRGPHERMVRGCSATAGWCRTRRRRAGRR